MTFGGSPLAELAMGQDIFSGDENCYVLPRLESTIRLKECSSCNLDMGTTRIRL
jgi:hypothetical protein